MGWDGVNDTTGDADDHHVIPNRYDEWLLTLKSMTDAPVTSGTVWAISVDAS